MSVTWVARAKLSTTTLGDLIPTPTDSLVVGVGEKGGEESGTNVKGTNREDLVPVLNPQLLSV